MKNVIPNPVNNGTAKAHRNRYCGPAVISSLTGMTTAEAARLLRHVSGKRSITGVATRHLLQALKMCGIHITNKTFDLSDNPTLIRFIESDDRSPCVTHLIVAGNHFQLVRDNNFVCGKTKDLVSFKDSRVKRRARVKQVFELVTDGIVIPDEARKPVRTVQNNETRIKCHKLAKQLGMTIDVTYNVYGWNYCICAEEDYTAMGVIDGCNCDDWDEVYAKLQQIEEYEIMQLVSSLA
jgi:hypothetical protein